MWRQIVPALHDRSGSIDIRDYGGTIRLVRIPHRGSGIAERRNVQAPDFSPVVGSGDMHVVDRAHTPYIADHPNRQRGWGRDPGVRDIVEGRPVDVRLENRYRLRPRPQTEKTGGGESQHSHPHVRNLAIYETLVMSRTGRLENPGIATWSKQFTRQP